MAKADAGGTPLAAGCAADAAWLSDLTLRGSQQNGGNDSEAAIMRLAAHPELLHRFLNEDLGPVKPPTVNLASLQVFLGVDSGAFQIEIGDQLMPRSYAYHRPASNGDRASSLAPLAFRPTDEDTRLAISAEGTVTPRGIAKARGRTSERLRLGLIAATALAVTVLGLLALA